MKPITFKIPVIPVSYNACFSISYANKEIYLKKKARDFKKICKLSCPPVVIPEQIKLSLYVEIHSSKWFYGNGKIRRIDLPNLDKLLIDSIFQRLGSDDSAIWDSRFRKVEDKEEYTLVTLKEYIL